MSYMLENDPYAGDPAREHNDHVAGMALNESQAAFQVSCAETRLRDDSAKITVARRSGKWVAAYEADVHCQHTDALIGFDTIMVGEFDSHDEALTAIGEDQCEYILPPREDTPEDTPQVAADISDDDIPF